MVEVYDQQKLIIDYDGDASHITLELRLQLLPWQRCALFECRGVKICFSCVIITLYVDRVDQMLPKQIIAGSKRSWKNCNCCAPGNEEVVMSDRLLIWPSLVLFLSIVIIVVFKLAAVLHIICYFHNVDTVDWLSAYQEGHLVCNYHSCIDYLYETRRTIMHSIWSVWPTSASPSHHPSFFE